MGGVLAGSQVRVPKHQADRRAGNQQLLGPYARTPWGAQNKIKGLSSLFIFSTEFFVNLLPFSLSLF
jgi:hypothetical protein